MNNTLVITTVLFFIGIITIPVVFSDDDYEFGKYKEYRQKSIGVANISHPVYKEECGSCHMVYPAGLLPAASWKSMMKELDNHFGDNAELDEDANKLISGFLQANSADQSSYRRSRKIMKSLTKDSAPSRITDTPYFKHEHDELPSKMVIDNKDVNSFSNCNVCHAKAEQGLFDEDHVKIPNFGHWDD